MDCSLQLKVRARRQLFYEGYDEYIVKLRDKVDQFIQSWILPFTSFCNTKTDSVRIFGLHFQSWERRTTMPVPFRLIDRLQPSCRVISIIERAT